jgi:hypothetical protein
MKKPRLYIPPARTRAELEQLLSSEDEQVVYRALIDAACHDPDCAWVQEQCLDRLRSASAVVRSGALHGIKLLTCVRHEIDAGRVLPRLKELLNNPESRWLAQDTIDDLVVFYPDLNG